MKNPLMYIVCLECACRGQHMVVFQIPGLFKFIMPKGTKGKNNKARGKSVPPRRRKRSLPQRIARPLASSSPDHQQACQDHMSNEVCRHCYESDGDESSGNANEFGASGQVIWGWNSGFSTGFLGHFPA